MPHLRRRFAADPLRKLARLWPVLGIVGARQAGKSTLARELLGVPRAISLDDLEAREEASKSPKAFLARLEPPVVIDEVQKAPELFDAIKLKVDRRRVPGSYYLTGSTAFSSRIGIRESLTGRIGSLELHPMTLAEIEQSVFRPVRALSQPLAGRRPHPRYDIAAVARAAPKGGMPVPAFLRDPDQRELYWRSWLETTILRDLARLFKRGYDPDLVFGLLARIGDLFGQGEIPTLKHFAQPAAKVRRYFDAMEQIFLLRRIPCHPEGIGKEVWLLMDSGLAAYLIGRASGEGTMLSIVRHWLWNEWSAQVEYQGRRLQRQYYKSAQGSPVDAVFSGVPLRIVATATAVTRQLRWEERPVLGAMKRLGSRVGYLVAPVDTYVPPPRRGGVGIIPWGAWS